MTTILSAEQSRTWTNRGADGARGDLANAAKGQPMAGSISCDLIETWLRSDAAVASELDALDPIGQVAAIQAALAGYCQVKADTDVIWFAVGNVAEHSGFVTSRRSGWTSENENGWTYQEVCGSHGTVLHEGPTEREAREVLDAWLVCDAPERGVYCYAHNPVAERSNAPVAHVVHAPATGAVALWLLAYAAVYPATAGFQGPLTITLLGRTFDTDRRVRASRENGPQAEEEAEDEFPPTVWEGPLPTWCAAVEEAAARPAFPPPGWELGPFERASAEARS